MKIKIELRPDEVDMAIRNYIRQSGMAILDDGDELDMAIRNYIQQSGMSIPDDGDVTYYRALTINGSEVVTTYEVEIE